MAAEHSVWGCTLVYPARGLWACISAWQILIPRQLGQGLNVLPNSPPEGLCYFVLAQIKYESEHRPRFDGDTEANENESLGSYPVT